MFGQKSGDGRWAVVKNCDHFSYSHYICVCLQIRCRPAARRGLHGCADEIRAPPTREYLTSPLQNPLHPLRLRYATVRKRIWMTVRNILLSVIWGSADSGTRPAPLRPVSTRKQRAPPPWLWLLLQHDVALYQRLRRIWGGAPGDTYGLCPIRASLTNRKMVRTMIFEGESEVAHQKACGKSDLECPLDSFQ